MAAHTLESRYCEFNVYHDNILACFNPYLKSGFSENSSI